MGWESFEDSPLKLERGSYPTPDNKNRLSQLAVADRASLHLAFDRPILPTSSHGHHFVITATDYFTKWVKRIPMAKASMGKVWHASFTLIFFMA